MKSYDDVLYVTRWKIKFTCPDPECSKPYEIGVNESPKSIRCRGCKKELKLDLEKMKVLTKDQKGNAFEGVISTN